MSNPPSSSSSSSSSPSSSPPSSSSPPTSSTPLSPSSSSPSPHHPRSRACSVSMSVLRSSSSLSNSLFQRSPTRRSEPSKRAKTPTSPSFSSSSSSSVCSSPSFDSFSPSSPVSSPSVSRNRPLIPLCLSENMSNPELKIAIEQFKKVSSSQIEQLQEEGYQYESAISTLLKKIAINRESFRNYSDEEIDYVLNRCPQNITRAGAIRILNLRDEVKNLREAGYMHRQVVEVLSQRLQKTSGFKRAARDESPCSFSSSPSPSSSSSSLYSVSSRSPSFSPPSSSFSPLHGDISLREKEKAPVSPTPTPPRKIRRKGDNNTFVVSEDQENERNIEGWGLGGEERVVKGEDERKRKGNSPGNGSRKRMKID